jgi:hypothetical protein
VARLPVQRRAERVEQVGLRAPRLRRRRVGPLRHRLRLRRKRHRRRRRRRAGTRRALVRVGAALSVRSRPQRPQLPRAPTSTRHPTKRCTLLLLPLPRPPLLLAPASRALPLVARAHALPPSCRLRRTPPRHLTQRRCRRLGRAVNCVRLPRVGMPRMHRHPHHHLLVDRALVLAPATPSAQSLFLALVPAQQVRAVPRRGAPAARLPPQLVRQRRRKQRARMKRLRTRRTSGAVKSRTRRMSSSLPPMPRPLAEEARSVRVLALPTMTTRQAARRRRRCRTSRSARRAFRSDVVVCCPMQLQNGR